MLQFLPNPGVEKFWLFLALEANLHLIFICTSLWRILFILKAYYHEMCRYWPLLSPFVWISSENSVKFPLFSQWLLPLSRHPVLLLIFSVFILTVLLNQAFVSGEVRLRQASLIATQEIAEHSNGGPWSTGQKAEKGKKGFEMCQKLK